jgi:hypothetical protein
MATNVNLISNIHTVLTSLLYNQPSAMSEMKPQT